MPFNLTHGAFLKGLCGSTLGHNIRFLRNSPPLGQMLFTDWCNEAFGSIDVAMWQCRTSCSRILSEDMPSNGARVV